MPERPTTRLASRGGAAFPVGQAPRACGGGPDRVRRGAIARAGIVGAWPSRAGRVGSSCAEPLEARRLMATFYVSPSGSDSNPGSFSQPVATINRALTLSRNNNSTSQTDTILIRGGVYRERPSIGLNNSGASPTDRTVISAYVDPVSGQYEGVYVLASDIITGTWTRDGTSDRWYRTGWTSKTAGLWVDWSPTNDGAPLRQIGNYPEDLTANSERERVFYGSGVADMTPGSFYHDTTLNRLYIQLADGGNPNTRQISWANRSHAIYQPGTASGSGFAYAQYLDIKGLKLRHTNQYISFGQDDYNAIYLVNDQRLIDADVRWNTYTGVSLYGASEAINCIVSDNGQTGLAGKGKGFRVQGGRYERNNNRYFGLGVSANIKIISNITDLYGDVIGAVVANSYDSPGLWIDTVYTNPVQSRFIGNTILDNDGPGIFLEVAANVLVANNIVSGNRATGILMLAAENCRIYNNTVVGNYGNAAIELNGGTRGSVGFRNNEVRNNLIVDNNTVFDLTLPQISVGTNVANNSSNYNLFYRRGGPIQMARGGTYLGTWGSTINSLAGWQTASGQDANSIVADPRFIAGGTGTDAFRLGSDSPARDAGVTVTGISNDFAGLARPTGTAFCIGAYETATNAVAGTAGPIIVNTDPTTWWDDVLPPNAQMTPPDATGNTGTNRFWYWTNTGTYSGALALDSGVATGQRRQLFSLADARPIAAGDVLYAWVYIDPANPTRQIALEFTDSTGTTRRAYWGPNLMGVSLDGASTGRSMGALPAAGQWTRLEIPAESLNVHGISVRGFALWFLDGRVLVDKVGNSPVGAPALGSFPTVTGTGTTLIQAENYNSGAAGVAYSDTTPGNQGSSTYRTGDVDLSVVTDGTSAIAVVNTAAGEWLRYTINVPQTSAYDLTLRLASAGAGNTLRVLLDEQAFTGTINLPDTGSTTSFTTVTVPGLRIGHGIHVIRLVFDTGNVAVNWLGFTNGAPDGIPFAQKPIPSITAAGPNRIEAEDWNDGGNGQAYSDTTGGNAGAAYRNSDGDVYTGTADNGSSFYIGNVAAAEWTKYFVTVADAGRYTLTARVASPNDGRRLRFFADAVDVTGTLTVPNTGSFASWADVTSPVFDLQAGSRVLRFVADDASFNLNYFTLTYVGPSAPSAVTLAAGSDTGVPADNLTRLNNASAATRLNFSVAGTAPGAIVRLFAGTTLLGTAVATGSITLVTTDGTTALPDGVRSFSATQTLSGFPESPSSASLGVTIDTIAPTLLGTPVINDAPTFKGRSQVRAVAWGASEQLLASTSSFTLTDRGTGASIDLASRSVAWSGTAVTLSLDTPGVDSGAQLFLPDANYELSLLPSVTDLAGNPIDANGNGTPGETARFRFHKLLGDFNGDRRVTSADVLLVNRARRQGISAPGWAQVDINISGTVTNADAVLTKSLFRRKLTKLTDGMVFS